MFSPYGDLWWLGHVRVCGPHCGQLKQVDSCVVVLSWLTHPCFSILLIHFHLLF